MNSDLVKSVHKKIRDEAVRWHVLLTGDIADESDWQAFTDWLETDEDHRQAYEAVEDILIGLSDIGSDMAGDNVVVVAQHRWRRVRRWSVAAAAALAAMVMVVTAIHDFRADNISSQLYATAIGERRLVTLADGSTIRLNTNSKVKVMFGKKIRRTELVYGQALFRVAKNTKRPFLVNLGDNHVLVVGTVFDISRYHKHVTVTVARGVVEVAPVSRKSPQEIVRLLPGSQLVHEEGTTAIKVSKVNPEVIMAWEKGYLEYDNAKITDVVDDLNRYFPTPIRVVGLARDLRFSGVIRTTDEKATLLILSDGLPVYIENRHGEMLVLPKTH